MTLPHDPALPQLVTVLDERVMAAVFAAARPGVTGCRIDRIKYRPRRNATVSYRLQLAEGGEQFAAVRWCSGGESLRRFVREPAGSEVLHLPALDGVAWFWPADAKLHAPRVLADDALLRREVLPPLLQPGEALLGHRVEIVQYVPESRLCARVHLHTTAGPRVLYAKASREPSAEEAFRLLLALQGRAGLRVPRPLAWQPAFWLFWQQAVPGVPLLDLPAAQQQRLAPVLGEQLARLHATPVALPRAITPAVLQQRLHEVQALLHDALPAARGTLGALADRLAAGIDQWASAPACTLHGDLHPRNVLAEGDGLSLIDLDGLRHGPAVLELGSWWADAMYRALLQGRAPATAQAGCEALLAGYVAAGGARPHPQALAWACAWNLLAQRAWRCVVNLKPGRLAVAPRLVELAATIAGEQALEAA